MSRESTRAQRTSSLRSRATTDRSSRSRFRIKNAEPQRLADVLERYCPMEVVVEVSLARPWLYDFLEGPGYRFVLAHPKKPRAIAEANYRSDAIDATLLARMRLVNLTPEAYCKPFEQREQATLVRHRGAAHVRSK